jgi:micrococcal nuclease
LGLFSFIAKVLFGPAPTIHANARRWEDPPLSREPPAERPRPLSSPQRQSTHRLLTGKCWVIDGDTIDMNGTRIRLAGTDAPEMDHPYGKNAKWTLINLCKGNEIKAVIELGSSYDRSVATCYLPDGRDLSAEMVKAGMAIDWKKFSGGKYRALETADARKRLWRCDARQKGRMPPVIPD